MNLPESHANLESLIKSIKLIVFDFDGVFTDNRVYVFEDGSEAVACSRSDGIGLRKLGRLGIETMVISTETNPVVSQRCDKLDSLCPAGGLRIPPAVTERLSPQACTFRYH